MRPVRLLLFTAFAACAIAIAACSDDEKTISEADVAGVWSVTYAVTQNTCSFELSSDPEKATVSSAAAGRITISTDRGGPIDCSFTSSGRFTCTSVSEGPEMDASTRIGGEFENEELEATLAFEFFTKASGQTCRMEFSMEGRRPSST